MSRGKRWSSKRELGGHVRPGNERSASSNQHHLLKNDPDQQHTPYQDKG